MWYYLFISFFFFFFLLQHQHIPRGQCQVWKVLSGESPLTWGKVNSLGSYYFTGAVQIVKMCFSVSTLVDFKIALGWGAYHLGQGVKLQDNFYIHHGLEFSLDWSAVYLFLHTYYLPTYFSGTFCTTQNIIVHRFTLNLHDLKIMMAGLILHGGNEGDCHRVPWSLPWCLWNASVQIYNFIIGFPLPRRKCLGALAL